MKLVACAVAMLLLVAQQDSDLVKAAKAAGGQRKSKSKVITNDDVKKSAKKKPLTIPSSKEAAAPAPPPQPATDTRGPLQKEDDLYHARAAATKRLADAEDHVGVLEAELRRIEQAYYATADLEYRDTRLVESFNQTRRQLDEARKELADARDALSKLQ